MLFRILLCLTLFAGAAHASPLDEALRAYDAEDFATAARLLAPLAEKGDATAQEKLSIMYFYGRGVPENEKLALQWALRSADQGNLEAMFLIGSMYLFGDELPATVKDPDVEAAKWYFEAGSRGHADAAYGLGLLFLAGKGVVQDQDEALRWIRHAAELGHAQAKSFLDK